MFDRMIEVCAGWDWVTPLLSFVQSWLYGPAVRFWFPRGRFSAAEVDRLLRKKGIKTWGSMVLGDTVTFCTTEKQAKYAGYWLRKGFALPFTSSKPKIAGA